MADGREDMDFIAVIGKAFFSRVTFLKNSVNCDEGSARPQIAVCQTRKGLLQHFV